jgi:hypothetical protein
MQDRNDLDTTCINTHATADSNAQLDTFAAELTRAAYFIALRHGAARTWLDLELDLWQALADTVQQWGRKSSRGPGTVGSPGLPMR